MDKMHLAIPTVPMQSWNETYSLEKALAEGTIFPELNKPFFVAPIDSNVTLPKGAEDEQILFSQICFAMTDAMLYLDTHPEDEQAKQYYQSCLKKKEEIMNSCSCGCACSGHYAWAEKPLVWEGGHC